MSQGRKALSDGLFVQESRIVSCHCCESFEVSGCGFPGLV